MLRYAIVVVLIGAVAGLSAALALTRLASAFLYDDYARPDNFRHGAIAVACYYGARELHPRASGQ